MKRQALLSLFLLTAQAGYGIDLLTAIEKAKTVVAITQAQSDESYDLSTLVMPEITDKLTFTAANANDLTLSNEQAKTIINNILQSAGFANTSTITNSVFASETVIDTSHDAIIAQQLQEEENGTSNGSLDHLLNRALNFLRDLNPDAHIHVGTTHPSGRRYTYTHSGNSTHNSTTRSSGSTTSSTTTATSSSPLHQAALQGNLDIVKGFVDANPSKIREKDAQGKTPLQLAKQYGKINVYNYLVQKAASEVSNDCPVCMETITNNSKKTVTNDACGHFVCTDCKEKLKEDRNFTGPLSLCPICRTTRIA